MAESEIFDRKAFLNRIGGNESLCDELVAIFLKRAPEQMHRLKAFLSEGDIERVKIEAHGLKGMAVNLSANRFSGIAAQIEKRAGTGNESAIPAMIEALESAFDEFTAFL